MTFVPADARARDLQNERAEVPMADDAPDTDMLEDDDVIGKESEGDEDEFEESDDEDDAEEEVDE